MKKLTLVLLLCIPFFAFSQDTLVTFTRVLHLDSVSKDQIFDKTLVWCSKAFTNSKSAINVQERSGGVIAGKALFDVFYYMPKGKKDSTVYFAFNSYYFDWEVKIKDGRIKFSVSNVVLKDLDSDFPVTSSATPPYKVMLQSKTKVAEAWEKSKQTFISKLYQLTESLAITITNKEKEW